MTRQEIIEILKDAKENDKNVYLEYYAQEHAFCSYVLHNYKFKEDIVSMTNGTWKYNKNAIYIISKTNDPNGNYRIYIEIIKIDNVIIAKTTDKKL